MLACLSILVALGVSAQTPKVQLSGWMLLDDDGTSFKTYKAHANVTKSVSTDWIHCNKQGVVSRGPHPTAAERKELISVAHQHGGRVFAMAVNENFEPDGVEVALASPKAMKDHVAAIMKIVLEDGVDGLDLDYESLNAKDREPFSAFVQMLGTSLHAKHKKLVIAVHGKESEPGTWGGTQSQDYAAIGKAVDSIRVMTYDFHWETSEAGPIAPPDWVERVMTFAKSVVPANKLELGIPAYGYDWLGKKANGIAWDQFTPLVKTYGPAKRDASQELVLNYKGRTIYFADGAASIPKFGISKKLGLTGLAMWRLGAEDPAFWAVYDKYSK